MTKTQRATIASYLTSVERIRITKTGEVHAYGVMPNSTVTGWYFAGYADDLLARAAAPAR